MSAGWWEKKLGAPKTTPPPATRPLDRRLPPVPPQTPQNVPNIQVTADNFAEASTHWTGGEGSRKEQMACPNCGSDLYFSRSNAGSVYAEGGVAVPAPRCYACGFTPGREMQGAPPA